MLDIDPGLDTRLRAFFEYIEAAAPPAALTDVGEPQTHHRGRTFNLIAGLAAVAVIAGSVTLFAVDLANHHGKSSASSLPASAAQLKHMPVLGNGGVPTSARVVIPLTRGHGSAQLKTFVPTGTLILQYDCAGPGSFNISSATGVIGTHLAHCSKPLGVTTVTVAGSEFVADSSRTPCPPNTPRSQIGVNVGCAGYDGRPLTLDITASPSMSWEILAAETTVWLPPPLPPQADYQVLVPLTYGAGSITMPTFSIAPDEYIRVNIGCNSGNSGRSLDIAPNPLWPDGQQVQCVVFNADGSISEVGTGPAVSDSRSGGLGPISLQFDADPSVNWELQVSEGPTGIILPELGNLGPVTQDVAVAPTDVGLGSAALPSFTPNQRYTMAFSCSGAGSLTIIIGGVAQVATPLCGGHTGWFTPPDQVPGRPVSLSVEASSSVGWEIEPVQAYGSTWGAGGPTMPNGS